MYSITKCENSSVQSLGHTCLIVMFYFYSLWLSHNWPAAPEDGRSTTDAMVTTVYTGLLKLSLATMCLLISTLRSMPTQSQLALYLVQLWQRGSSRDRRDRLLLWFCCVILFPLLVVTYWSFMKTEWVRFQCGSINCPPAIRRENQSQLSPAFRFYASPLSALVFSSCCFSSYLSFLCCSVTLSFSLEKPRSLIAV